MPQYGEEAMLIFKMAPRIMDECSEQRAAEPRSIPSSVQWPSPYWGEDTTTNPEEHWDFKMRHKKGPKYSLNRNKMFITKHNIKKLK